MASLRIAAAVSLGTVAIGQLAGEYVDEWHIPLTIERCSKTEACQTEETQIVMDMQWRWTHNKDGYDNCLLGEIWDPDLCPNPVSCAQNCAVEGVNERGYTQTYKAWPVEKGITLRFPNAPRTYVLENEDHYKMFQLKNREFTFDVDLSKLPCGMNAALYFIEMNQDGDKNDLNKAGPKYGTGYCDAQCPAMRWIEGGANLLDWEKVRCAENPDGEVLCGGHHGRYGYCCAEMDVLEANREAGVFTAHPCTVSGPKICDSHNADECGDRGEGVTGFCDKDGCGFSDYRMGNESFWGVGPGFVVDTNRPITVVTQFVTSNGTDAGDLVEVRRFYQQEGKLIKNSETRLLDRRDDSITDAMCDAQNRAFQEPQYSFGDAGKLKAMGEALGRGMVLSMSIWDDDFSRMLWLDGEKSRYDQNMSKPGVKRGPCPFKYGTRQDMLDEAEAHGPIEVTFTNVRYGEIDSTYSLI